MHVLISFQRCKCYWHNIGTLREILRTKIVLFGRYTPGIYEVYRGYIVFVFSVKMCVSVCVCVNFFSVKDFFGTA